MNKFIATTLPLAAVIGLLTACSTEQKQTATKPEPAPAPAPVQAAPVVETPLTVERSADVSMTARVKSINYTTREVTLEDSAGRTTSFVAGPQVRRLNEVQVGDYVAAQYSVSVVAELRPPTAEESANPISAVAIAGRSPQGATPAGSAGQAVRVVTTVEAVDQATMLITLKGPMGDTTTIRGRNPDNVKRLHVGDTIVITYTEAVAVALSKSAAK